MQMDMNMMDNAASTMLPLLLRSMASSAFIYADKSLFNLAEKFKPLEIISYLLMTSFIFLRLLSFLFLPDLPPKSQPGFLRYAVTSGADDSGIARALSQVLSIVNDVPVRSRKYVIVRSLAETLIEENRREDTHGLREVNRTVLSSAFSRTLCYLEAAMVELGQDRIGAYYGNDLLLVKRVLRVVRSVGDGVWVREGSGGGREDVTRSGDLAEKLAAELLWLAEKMVASGFGEEAVERWASASNLALHSLLAEPRLQGTLVKVLAFLFKQGKWRWQRKRPEKATKRATGKRR
ncbi:uncharacterized protein LOC120178009 [Hibiscus syriacus]|uniref:uncharacterized protein LOC120178009 n=1 Tax=Hibiscus syriacus TaxID=106335 RepID=UPI001922BB67|nr:uncharacterized protein LOC120178009 [Hibiscus syriacus]